jgi:uncharacterized protein
MQRILYFAVFLFVAVSIIVLVHLYLYARLVRDPTFSPPLRQGLTAALIVLGASLPLSFVVSRALSPGASRVVLVAPYFWMGMMLYLVLLFGVFDLLLLAARAAARLARSPALLDEGRRLFLSRLFAAAASAGTLGLTVAGAVRAISGVGVKELEVVLPRLPPALDGLTIVQLTDLHLGPTLGREWLAGVLAKVRALRPDLVAITGDLVDGTVSQLGETVSLLAGLKDAPLGVYFVTGNHEYYSGVDEWIAELRRLGVRVLRNERVAIGRGEARFDLVGVDDHEGRRHDPHHGPDLPRALAGRDPARAVVLLAHQPRAVFEAAEHDVGLLLSGHTHGGQFWPWHYLVRLQQPYVSGLHRHGPTTQVYVSEGTGFWGPPLRLGTRGEITRIVLRARA